MGCVVFIRNNYLCKYEKVVWRRVLMTVAAVLLHVGVVLSANNKFTLVIDAGHGGHDTGALGSISKEKDINLKVALAFGQYVERNCPDVSVIYTRKADVFIPLQERANIANKNNADLFISVHTNALPAGKIARGFETYTLGMHRVKENLDVAMRENSVISMEKDYESRYQGFDPNSSESYIMFEFMQTANMEKSVELARMIQKSVCKTAGRNNKGVHQAGFLVLRQTSMPSCLLELGFITTSDEEEFLNTESGIDAMACGIYNAFAEYKNKYSDKIVVPYAAPKKQGFGVGHVVPQTPETTKTETGNGKKPVNKGNGGNQKPVAQKKVAETSVQEATKKVSDKTTTVNKQEKDGVRTAPVAKETVIDKDVDKADDGKPVFKVQVFVVNRVLRPGSQQFKGHADATYYKDGSSVKYTIGSSTDYNEMLKLRKTLLKDFPEAFVVAFKNGERVDITKAVAEYKKGQR